MTLPIQGTDELLRQCYKPLIRQIGWFERYRQAEGAGFFYTDILDRTWESGVDECGERHTFGTSS